MSNNFYNFFPTKAEEEAAAANFYNFFPTKAEEEAAAAAAAAAGSSSGQTALSSSEANMWTITKVLSISDIEETKLILLNGVEDNILCYLHPELAANALAGKQAMINMKDVDTGDLIGNMAIIREPKKNKFYLKGHWKSGFVQRRDLQIGHQVGLRWNVEEHYLEFSKLN